MQTVGKTHLNKFLVIDTECWQAGTLLNFEHLALLLVLLGRSRSINQSNFENWELLNRSTHVRLRDFLSVSTGKVACADPSFPWLLLTVPAVVLSEDMNSM